MRGKVKKKVVDILYDILFSKQDQFHWKSWKSVEFEWKRKEKESLVLHFRQKVYGKMHRGKGNLFKNIRIP